MKKYDFISDCMSALKPPPNYTVSQWADKYRYIASSTSAYGGRWSTDNAPEFRYIMDCVNDPNVEQISMMICSQSGKTEALLNVLGFYIHTDPCPILILQPTEDMAASFSKERINPTIKATPVLNNIIDVDKKSPENNINYKSFPGGYMVILGTQTPSKLASRPIRIILADEIDRFATDAGGEGDPLQLAKKRTANFWNRKWVQVSTPTDEGVSRIEPLYNESSKDKYYVTCKDCGEKQFMKWEQIHWDKEKDDLGKTIHHPETAHYVCEHCGSLWDDVDRLYAIAHGEWISHNPEVTSHKGFHLPRFSTSMCSRLEDIVREFIVAKESPMRLKVFVNTVLAQTWKHGSETVKASQLLERREEWDDDVMPENSCYITGSVDVQGDRIELMLTAWGASSEQWCLEHRRFYGDPVKDWEVWDTLEKYLKKQFWSEHYQRHFSIERLVIDSGAYTEHIYKYCYDKPKDLDIPVLPIKGSNQTNHPIYKLTQSKKYKKELYIIGTQQAKTVIYQNLAIKDHGASYCHFNMRQDYEFFEQLTSHVRVLKTVSGKSEYVWQKKKEGARDEIIDLMVYNYFAMRHANIDFPSYMAELEHERDNPVRTSKNLWEKI